MLRVCVKAGLPELKNLGRSGETPSRTWACISCGRGVGAVTLGFLSLGWAATLPQVLRCGPQGSLVLPLSCEDPCARHRGLAFAERFGHIGEFMSEEK